MKKAARIAMLLLATVTGQSLAQQAPADPMVPDLSENVGTVSPLRMVTVTTGDMAVTRRFYVEAMGMTATGVPLGAAARATLARHWRIGPKRIGEVVVFENSQAPGAGRVRAVAVAAGLPPARRGRDSRFLGALGFGFASSDLADRETQVSAKGFRSSVGVKRMDFSRADGSKYNVAEIHFLAPDDVLVLGVDRGSMRPVGPIDPATKVGGVAYASALVGDVARSHTFLSNVIGLHLRRRTDFQGGGAQGGMIGLTKGEPVAFEQWFSGGASTGYLVIMQRLRGERVMPAAYGLDARGVAMWTFETRDLEGSVARAKQVGIDASIASVDLPGFGIRRTALMRSPDNLTVELVEAIPVQ